jgi:hypothetical protein
MKRIPFDTYEAPDYAETTQHIDLTINGGSAG